MVANNLIKKIIDLGGKEIIKPNEVVGGKIVYIVVNGEDVLAIGQGNKSRLTGLMKGQKCKKHTKAFLVAASHGVYGDRFRYFFKNCENEQESKELERQLKDGVGDFYLSEYPGATTLKEGSEFLWSKIKDKHKFDEKFMGCIELVLFDGDVLYLLCNKLPKYKMELQKLFDGYYRLI